jgi:two-component system LytT family sensor kinase
VGRSLRTQILAAAAFWVAVSSLYTAQLWWLSQQLGPRGQALNAVLWTGSLYLYWIPLTLVVWQVTRGWTPSRLGWPRYLGQHLALGVAMAAVHNTIMTLGNVAFFAPPGEGFGVLFPAAMRNRSYLELIVYAGVVASGQALSLYARWRDRDAQAARLEAQLSAAKLSALEAQVQPHFLFNSLHTIASLARDGRNADVVRLIADLSELLRAVTDQHQSTRPLSDEVALTERYLDIQQARFGERLNVTIEIDPVAARVHVPTLTLQPIVDNAIRHGLSNSIRGGTISIRATVDRSSLTLIVEDDGAGAGADWRLDKSTGTGLINLQSRLGILYGDLAGFAAGPRQSEGFQVTVQVPVSA